MAREDLIQIRGGDAATWTSTNPVLGLHEPGYETDSRKSKHGDGSTAWNSLLYDTAETTSTLEQVIVNNPNATSVPEFQGGLNVGFDNGAPAIITLKGGVGGGSGQTVIASTTGGLAVSHAVAVSLTTPSLLINGATAVITKTSGEPSGSDEVFNMISLTQAEYDAGTPVATTFYIITDA